MNLVLLGTLKQSEPLVELLTESRNLVTSDEQVASERRERRVVIISATRPGIAIQAVEAEYKNHQGSGRGKERVSNSSKLFVTERNTNSYKSLADNGMSVDSAPTMILDKMGEQDKKCH